MIVIDDLLFDKHQEPGSDTSTSPTALSHRPHPERPERLIAARAAIQPFVTSTSRSLPATNATLEELLLVHTRDYLERLERLSSDRAPPRGFLDNDTYYCEASNLAARRAAGASVSLVRTLVSDPTDRLGVALVRPPGHHALPDRAMGFCLLNNVAVAARVALQEGSSRVAILDIDVHHGNGTEHIFYDEARVLYLSVHEWPQYPGTGRASDIGQGSGRGFTSNIPLTSGAGNAAYELAMRSLVAPILQQFAPDLLIVSAGFDAHKKDPLGGMMLDGRGYSAIGQCIRATVPTSVPTALILEGGYDLEGIQEGLSALLFGLGAPVRPDAESFVGEMLRRPFESRDCKTAPFDSEPQDLRPVHAKDIENARRVFAAHWRV